MANKFLPHNVQVNETKFYNRHAISMLPTMPVPVETIQSAEITSPTSAQNSSNNSNVVVGSNPCAVPIATLSIRDLRLRGSSFIRSHASKHGLPNASRKLMKEVIELLKSHYAVVHQVAMLEDDFGDAGAGTQSAGGGKAPKKKTNSPPKMHSGNTTMVASYHMKNSSPTMLPQRAMSLVPFQVQMPPDQALFSQVASIVDRLPVDRRLHTMQEVPAMTHMLQHSVMQQQQQQIQQQPQQQTQGDAGHLHNGSNPNPGPGGGGGVGSPCSARILARTRGELTSFGTSLLRPEAAAHKVHNSSRKPKHVVIDELWRHYMQCHAHELMATTNNQDESGCIGNVIDDEDDK